MVNFTSELLGKGNAVWQSRFEFTHAKGKIVAHARANEFDSARHCRDALHKELNTFLMTIQMLSHRPYELPEPAFHILSLDGKKNYFMFCEAGKYELKGGTVDFVHRDRNGRVLRDTRAERLDFLKEVATKSASYCDDSVLQAMLKSYQSAIQEPNNELIHLYEIQEMGESVPNLKEILKQARINKKGGSDFGEIANKPQYLQGRHRGKEVGKGLVVASKEDIEIARSISRDIVCAYLKILSQNQPVGAFSGRN